MTGPWVCTKNQDGGTCPDSAHRTLTRHTSLWDPSPGEERPPFYGYGRAESVLTLTDLVLPQKMEVLPEYHGWKRP